ncbi:hypothetical protein X773_01200 [Mesorhizobium sp. LSJC285A00]|uniref:hypothetical protein n=1 Tax=Mesorhizobium sp. LSJC285A00 TaxID=1287338 RepID=UPI0003CEBC4D|nr:hypothetical protein [Mesorhizobium sp. LSJC285A00]ESW91723.1 hypothetical protein X773_01200 [Mesorhizobium sp. LSJC285A00]
MTGRPATEDHVESDNVERGVLFLADTPRHLRGPAVPALKAIGLTAKESCEALRVHGLKMARST